MPDIFDKLLSEVKTAVDQAFRWEMGEAIAEEKESLSRPGSPVPFIASQEGEPSTNWYPASPTNLVNSITGDVSDNADKITLRVVSDAVDEYVNIGHHFSADVEFGHWWDGWAFDPVDSTIKKVAPAHQVGPRPHHRPQFERSAKRMQEELVTALRKVG